MKEREIQREIVTFLRTIGCAVYETSQGYRKEPGGTRMTPGIPDLYVVGPHTKASIVGRTEAPWTWAEVKTPKGQLSPAQEVFRATSKIAHLPWQLWRDVDDAWRWACDVGIIEEAA